tara:strand:+ start:69 stop:509 length:441 start_codon:yes stop_codon:yes gene_type:complete
MINKIFCSFLSLVFLVNTSFAQEAVMKTINKGDPAPFSGTLLNKEAVAETVIQIKSANEQCELKLKKDRELQKANFDLSIEKLKIANNFEISVYKSQNEFLRSQIDLSTKELERKQAATEWWFVGGFVVGALISLGAGYVANKISN